jgi:hypothetical protein
MPGLEPGTHVFLGSSIEDVAGPVAVIEASQERRKTVICVV